MVGKEDAPGNPLPPAGGSRKLFWRSASWSSSRTALQNPESEEGECGVDLKCSDVGSGGNAPNRRYPPAPLTPRSQHKARACLPPLQPLSIARRSLEEWPKAGSDDIGEWPQPPTPGGNKCSERLKLDLSSIQRIPDKSSGMVKRDKIAFFDKECSKVAEHVYLGGDAVAKDREILKQNGITHVLNCVGFVCPEYFRADFVYRTLWLQDSPSEDITSILYDVFDYFEDVREQSGRVFVHCCQGVSRSTSLVIAYLMWREGQSFDDAFQYVKSARGIADPNMGFACQLLQCQKRVHAFPLSPSSLLRMYRIAPHSPYDPLHLVPRLLNDPSPFALDSRGSFIVHIPNSIYIWVGENCDAIMERDARGAVGQIVRYERAQGPVQVIREGEEPRYFWDAFSNYLPLMDKSVEARESIGKNITSERKVDAYDVDFEVFQKAIKGGVVPPFASSENEHETHLPAQESSWSLLRRKFAPVDMKEFVMTPKIFSRVYSDSMMIVHSSSPSSKSSLFSSSSSPPYLSPDSVSSDSSSSSKHLSESSLDSPIASSCCVPVSSTLSNNLSNLSLQSSKPSSKQYAKAPGCVDVNIMSPIHKSSPSLAERRGSLSKSLKLPVITDNMKGNATPPSSITNNTFTWSNADSMDIVLESKIDVKGGKVDPAQQFISNIPPDTVDCSSHCNLEKPLICRWPSLERVATFGANKMDPKTAFAILAPTTSLGTDGNRILFFWIGKSFYCDKSWIQVASSRMLEDLDNIDWNQEGCQVLTQLGLPKDAPVSVQVCVLVRRILRKSCTS